MKNNQNLKKPNILYIMTDQQRFDSLGCVKQSICRTPTLDRLAEEGMRFDNAYTVCALCSPARTSMLTGKYPHNHGMWCNNSRKLGPSNIPEGQKLISEYLCDSGYNCGYTGKWHCGIDKVPSNYGFEGMDVPGYGNPYNTVEYSEYCKRRGLKKPVQIKGIGYHSFSNRHYAGTFDSPVEACEPYFLAQHAIDKMCEFKKRQDENGKPFMMFVSFWGPHFPCFVPEPYASMYNPDDIVLWPSFDEEYSKRPPHIYRHSGFHKEAANLSKCEWKKLIAKYWGYCTFIDSEIGRMLQALKDMGIYEETAIMFSTDHGDMQGAHGRIWDKGPVMYEDIYHIPLIVKTPEIKCAGQICNKLVMNMDIASTVLDLAGIPVPEEFDGRSLLPLLNNPDTDLREALMCELNGFKYFVCQRMVRWSKYKYIFNPTSTDELYDLNEDPYEMNNLECDMGYKNIVCEGREKLLYLMGKSSDPIINFSRETLMSL
jgi:arylsulfatase A-like enzyme